MFGDNIAMKRRGWLARLFRMPEQTLSAWWEVPRGKAHSVPENAAFAEARLVEGEEA